MIKSKKFIISIATVVLLLVLVTSIFFVATQGNHSEVAADMNGTVVNSDGFAGTNGMAGPNGSGSGVCGNGVCGNVNVGNCDVCLDYWTNNGSTNQNNNMHNNTEGFHNGNRRGRCA